MPSLTDRDEFPHVPPSPQPDRWQENFFVVGWDKAAGSGFLIHCKRWPAKGEQVARVAVCIAGRIASTRIVEPVPDSRFTVGGLELVPVEPYRNLRFAGSFHGAEGKGPLGFIAWTGAGETEVAVDLELSSSLPPADFGEAFEKMAAQVVKAESDARVAFEHTQTHYEQGGKCRGTIRIGDQEGVIDGLFVRDHTWGERDESGMSATGHGFWTASVSDDASLFFNAMGVVVNGVTKGAAVVVDSSGCHTTTDIAVEFLPVGGLGTFDSTHIRIGGKRPLEVHGKALEHLVKYLPGSGPGRFDENGISSFIAGDITGFGVHEFAGTLPADLLREIESFE